LSEVDTLQPRLTPTPPDDLVNVQHRLAIQIIPLGDARFVDINRLALWLPDRLFEVSLVTVSLVRVGMGRGMAGLLFC